MWGNTNWINSEYRHFSRSVFELINYILKTINLIKSDLTRQDQIWSPLSKRHKIHKYNFDCFHGNGILSACPGVSQFCQWPGQSDTKKKIRNLQKKKRRSKIITENNKNWTKIRVRNKTMCLLSWNRAYIYNKINICKPLLKVYI